MEMSKSISEKITLIRPKKTFSIEELKEIWSYKELLYFFSWRDIKVRYKQTFIGIGWAIIQPLITMIVFSLFFGELAKVPSDGVPYPIFIFVGLIFWQFFSTSISEVSNILISNQSIITKVYFPKIILPISTTVVKLIDFIIASFIFIGLMVYFKTIPDILSILVIPLLVLMTFMASLGIGLILASINVKYRDVRYVLPFFIQILMYLTPVIYPASILSKYSWILALNPMTGVIQTARAVLLGTTPINWLLVFISFLATLVLLIIGIYVFKKTEDHFADII